MSELQLDLGKYERILRQVHLTRDSGKVTEVTGLAIRGYLPGAAIGSTCEVYPALHQEPFLCEVIGFHEKNVLLMPLGPMRGVGLGAPIILSQSSAALKISNQMLGRVIDALGNPIDGKGEIEMQDEVPLYAEARNPLERVPIRQAMDLGVKALNGLLTIGKGQRVSIMAGSGVGKSVLLGMMSRYSRADVNVIAMIGERGREVREFIENDLGEEGLKRSVVVVATSDQSPLLRIRGAYAAAAIAEYFAAQRADVLLMMDSITRFAMAQREVGLTRGEPPATKGYTPSVFSTLPKLLERAGSFNNGTITGLFTVLVEGDDMDDPIGDAVRSIVDGHIVLSRNLAHRGHYPAIDVLQSNSRVMRYVTSPEHVKIAQKVREHLAVYREAEDLIRIGAYKNGSDPKIDEAIRVNEGIVEFLRQSLEEHVDFASSAEQMAASIR